MSGVEVVELAGDDWSAIYFDGELIDSGHSPRLDRVLMALMFRQVLVKNYEYVDVADRGYDYGDGDAFPERLDLESYGKEGK